jgi:hypothetical protein
MKITKATYTKPDSDDNITFEVTAEVENSKEEIVEMSKSSLSIIDDKGNSVSCEYDREENSYAEKNETFTVNLSSFIKKSFVSDLTKLKALVDLTTFKKEFKKLGFFEIPNDHKSSFKNNDPIDFGKLRVFGTLIYRTEPPENASDDHTVVARIIVKNMANIFVQKISVKIQLVDRTGSNLSDSEDYKGLAPNASTCFEVYASAKSGKLKEAKLEISISSFHVVEHLNSETPFKILRE